MQAAIRRLFSFLADRPIALGLVPILLLIGVACGFDPEDKEVRTGQPQAYPVERNFRTVLVILDSCPSKVAFDPSLMPFVSSLRSSSLSGRQCACIGKATFPCMKSIFEGRVATTGTALQDFSAVASERTTWPGSLAALGLRIAAVSDHTLNRLYPGAFVHHLDYQTLDAPIMERDKYGYEKTWEWLSDPSINVVISHIIGTDKVSHEFPVMGDVYRAKYLEADDFVRKVSERLGPNDYLYILSDHGHDETGGHTLDAMYFARGPLFRPGQEQDVSAEDMFFLLSAPYGLLMPDEYEGKIRTDLTLLTPERRQQYLIQQAKMWKIAVVDSEPEAIEKQLNEFVSEQRKTSLRNDTLEDMGAATPWWLAAAFFLLGEFWGLTTPARSRSLQAAVIGLLAIAVALVAFGIAAGAWIFTVIAFVRSGQRLGVVRMLAVIALLAAAAVMAFWFMPSVLAWVEVRGHRFWSYAGFYAVALALGALISSCLGAENWRRHGERSLWIAGLCIWLFAYSGLYDYSLTRQGPRVVLGVFSLVAVVLRGGWRTLFSGYALCVLALLPFVFFKPESFNLDYPLLQPCAHLHWGIQLACALFLGFILAMTLRQNGVAPMSVMSILGGIGLVAAWVGVGRLFFEFNMVKLIGCLVASVALAGFLLLFRRSNLPGRWTALAGAIVLFVTLTMVLNGLQLSHVEFRFAANKIIAFREEVWRAPQLILWSMIKYSFALLPALYTLRVFSGQMETPKAMLQLDWWRGLMIVLAAFGLALFDPRGLHELCGEEMYFWLFLSIVMWVFCLTMPRRETSAASA